MGAPMAAGRGEARRCEGTIALLCAAVLFVIYSLNGDFLAVNDATGTLYAAVSVVEDGDLAVSPSEAPFMFTWALDTPNGTVVRKLKTWDDEIEGQRARDLYRTGAARVVLPDYYVVASVRADAASGERLYVNTFGPGAALTAAPILGGARLVFGPLASRPWVVWYAGKVTASALVAASAAFLYLAARPFLPTGPAVLLALLYGLGTCVWSTSSQTLWQHAPNAFFLAAGMYFLGRGSLRDAVSAGLALGCATASRPTSAIVAGIMGVHLLLRDRRRFGAYTAAVLLVGTALGAYNTYYQGSPFSFGQATIGATLARAKTGSPDVWQTPLLEGLAGLLLSPSRGLLVFSPFFAVVPVAIWRSWGSSEYGFVRPLTVAVCLILIVEAKHFDWWGGWSYGYRHIVDTTVLLSMLLIPAVQWIRASRARRVGFAVLATWSIAVQAVGAFAYDIYGWNARLDGYELRVPGQPDPIVVRDAGEVRRLVATRGARVRREVRLDVDKRQYRSRLWSLRDNQIAYYLSHLAASRRAKHESMALLMESFGQPDAGGAGP